MRFRRSRQAVRVLNVTPLIDVVFILLVFFMLATNFANYRLIRVETPRETEVVSSSEGAIVVEVRADGSLRFDTAPLEVRDLLARVGEVVAIDPGRAFLVRPEPGVSLQEAIDIFDRVRAGGARTVSFSDFGAGDGPS